MAVQVHIGDVGEVVVEMTDASGNVTNDWDVAGGVQWTSDDDSKVTVTDDDAEPRDAKLAFLALTDAGTPVKIRCSFDGRVGPETNPINLESEDIEVVPGEATGGTVRIVMQPAPPPA